MSKNEKFEGGRLISTSKAPEIWIGATELSPPIWFGQAAVGGVIHLNGAPGEIMEVDAAGRARVRAMSPSEYREKFPHG